MGNTSGTAKNPEVGELKPMFVNDVSQGECDLDN